MKVAIVGCGNIGSGLAKLFSKHYSVSLYDRNFKETEALAKSIKAKAYSKIDEAVKGSDIVLIAVKPQSFNELASALASHLTKKQLIVSIMTGITQESMQAKFKGIPVLRIMSNIAMFYGKGVVAVANNENLSESKKTEINDFLKHLGSVHWIPESKIDALTSLIGSGPAFVLAMIEAMTEAGVAMGFPADDSLKYVEEMLEGTLTLLDKTGSHPAELRWKICSPGGTTIAGLRKFEEKSVRSGILETFIAAYNRAQELGK